MKRSITRIAAMLICALILLPCLPFGAQAAAKYAVREPQPDKENDPNDPNAAQNISGIELLTAYSGLSNPTQLFDKDKITELDSWGNPRLTLEYEDGIGSLYLIFGEVYGCYTVINNDTGASVTCGQNNFYHEVIRLTDLFGGPVRSVTLDFADGAVRLIEIHAYTQGYLPDYVQEWQLPEENKTDLILFSTHGDDEQLFFAGLLPYYCALDYEVLVVYMTDHRNLHDCRVHEMLNGLWACGVTTYPVFGSYDDIFTEDMNLLYTVFGWQGVTRDELIGYVVEQLRRFKPMVVVGHDFAGEYKHGQHMVYADMLAAALAVSNDANAYPELAEKYGLWDVPKAYFHLYEENPIIMDWDTPMEELDGMTPFEVTQLLGYTQHISQRESWVSNWINGEHFDIHKAADIEKYSPCEYGLYRSTVGPDILKNDMFENVLSYAQQEKKAEEDRLAELERQEAERKAAEESAQQEAERKAAEQEAERKAAEEARLAEEARAEEQARNRIIWMILICVGIGSIMLIALAVLFAPRRHGHYEKRKKEK